MVLRESLWMVAAGMVVGIPAALALTRLVRQALYGIEPNDPLSFVAAGMLMVDCRGGGGVDSGATGGAGGPDAGFAMRVRVEKR